jgi:LysM repeat protein
MKQSTRRAAQTIRAGGLLTGIAVFLGWSAGSPIDTWHALAAAVDSSSAPASFDQLLMSSAALAAWVGLGWLSIAIALEVASVLPGVAGRRCAAVAARTTPMLLRRIVHAAIGVSVLAGPLTAGSAFAAGPSTNPSATTTSAASAPTPRSTASPLIQLDRPHSRVAPALVDAGPSPLELDRPAAAFVASPPPVPMRTSAGTTALMTGVAHRDTGEPGDRSVNGYVVRRGDTLWDIAARHLGPSATAVDISRVWPTWYEANRSVIGSDPGVIRPGELLSAPSGSTASVSTR